MEERQNSILAIPLWTYNPDMGPLYNLLSLLRYRLRLRLYLFQQLVSGIFGTDSYMPILPSSSLSINTTEESKQSSPSPSQLPPSTPAATSTPDNAQYSPVTTITPEQSASPATASTYANTVVNPARTVEKTPQMPRTTYVNTEEWELKRDENGRLEAIIIHRKATEESETANV